jgi:hypothetical protein
LLLAEFKGHGLSSCSLAMHVAEILHHSGLNANTA